MRHKKERRNTPEAVEELKQIDQPAKFTKEVDKVSGALSNLATDKQDNSAMGQRIYSVPSQDKLNRSKLAQKTGQIPKSVNVYGSHYPVVRLLDDNKTLLLHTSEYGNDGKTKELVAKIKQDLPNHFPDAKVIEIHHPDYRHSAKVMRSRDPKEFSNYLKLASEKHPDENYRSHALDALNHLSSLKKAEYGKPIHAKRTEGEGFDYEANLKNRLDKIHGYLTKIGLSLDTSEGKSRNLGAHNPSTITINTEGDPHDQQALHEAGHALLTPPNQSISEYQWDIGKPGFQGKITQTQNRQKLMESHGGGMPEQTAQHMEAGIARRSGIEPFRSPKRGKEGSQEEKARTHAKNTLKDLDEGIYKFNFKTGQKELQSNPNTMINARARGDKQLVNQMADQYKQKLQKQDMKLAASENSESDLAKGQNGDWQKEGYILRHTTPEDHGKYVKFTVHAISPQGETIGKYDFFHNHDANWSGVLQSNTHTNHQRKGLATSAYQLAEQISGKPLLPQDDFGAQTEDAEALWNQPSRPFGKNLAASENSESDLAKGSLQSKNKVKSSDYKPNQLKDINGWIESSHSTEIEPTDEHRKLREKIPTQSKAQKLRMILRLSKTNSIRKHPESGEYHIMLHRAMSPDEHDNSVVDGIVNHDARTSWTPHYQKAANFARHNQKKVVSAWVPLSHVANSLAQIPENKQGESRVFGNVERGEDEFIIEPNHKSPLSAGEVKFPTNSNTDKVKESQGKIKDHKTSNWNKKFFNNKDSLKKE